MRRMAYVPPTALNDVRAYLRACLRACVHVQNAALKRIRGELRALAATPWPHTTLGCSE